MAYRMSDLSPEELEGLERQVDSEVTVQGGRSKPTIRDTLAFQLIYLPVALGKVFRNAVDLNMPLDCARDSFRQCSQKAQDCLTDWDFIKVAEMG